MFGSIFGLFVWGFIAFAIISLFSKIRAKHFNHKSFLDIASSQEDMLSQVFFLLGIFSFAVMLLAFNRDLGNFLEWQTIILISSLLALFIAYYVKIIYALPFAVLGIFSWWITQMLYWADPKDIKTSFIFTGMILLSLILYMLGAIHRSERKFKRFSLVYTVLGMVFFIGFIFFLSSKWGMESLEDMTSGKEILSSWQIAVSYLFMILIFVSGFILSLYKKYISKYELLLIFCAGLFFSALVFFPELRFFETSNAYNGYYYGKEFSSFGIVWAFIFNIFIFLQVLGVILLGYISRQEWFINLGAFFLFILIGIKYFDWFFTFFDKSIFFISAGIIMFIVGWFMEKGRRYMLSITASEKGHNEN